MEREKELRKSSPSTAVPGRDGRGDPSPSKRLLDYREDSGAKLGWCSCGEPWKPGRRLGPESGCLRIAASAREEMQKLGVRSSTLHELKRNRRGRSKKNKKIKIA